MSLIHEDTLRKLKLKLQPLSPGQPSLLISVLNKPLEIIGETQAVIDVHGLKIYHTFIVVKSICHALLIGTDFLTAAAAVVDFANGWVTFADELTRLPLITPNRKKTGVFTISSIYIPPLTEAYVQVRCPSDVGNATVLIEPNSRLLTKNVATARALTKCDKGKVLCKLLNFSITPRVLPKNTLIASVETMDNIASCKTVECNADAPRDAVSTENFRVVQPPEILEKFKDEYNFAVGDKLEPNQRLQLLQLLFDYKDVFARSLREIQQYENYELELDLLSNRRCFKRQYRMTPEDAEIAQKQIDEMREAKLIEPSETIDYNSPLLLVSKKTGDKRLCIDLRQVNRVIAPRLVQLPRINDILDSMLVSKPTLFTCIDLRSGYYQVKLSKRSRGVTSFTAPNGLRWQYTVVPFGMNVAPSAMLTVIQSLFSAHHGVSAYMDDIATVSNTFEQHIQNLKAVLQTLRENKLSANPTKCIFGDDSIEYLGHRISAKGIQMSRKKVAIVQAISPPKSVKALQRLLGMINFYRKHICGYAKNTFHMRQLLLKGAHFDWTSECQAELDYIKDALCKDPVLCAFNTEKPVTIYTDASTKGLAYAAVQTGDDGKEHVIAYGGRALSKAQERYTTSELEIMSVVLALRDYETFLRRQHVIVVSDNSTVLHLDRFIPVNARQTRLLAYLMQYQLTVKFIRGCHNFTADTLSRIFEELPETEKTHFMTKEDDKTEFIVNVNLRDDDERRKDEKITVVTPSREMGDNVNKRQKRRSTREDASGTQGRTEENRSVGGPVTRSRAAATSIHENQQAGADGRDEQPAAHSDATAANMQQPSEPDMQSMDLFDINILQSHHTQAADVLRTEELLSEQETAEPNNDTTDTDDGPLINIDVKTPTITVDDYKNDDEFSSIYNYLQNEELTGNDKTDKVTLLVADSFLIENELLYRLTTPRNKRERRLRPLVKRLCVPLTFRYDLINHIHCFLDILA